MKKLWLALLIVVALCVPAQAGTNFPDYFEGERFPSGTWAIQIWPDGGINVPISTPQNDTIYYESVLRSWGEHISVEVVCMAQVGIGCIAGPPLGWGAMGDFYWNEDSQSYARGWVWPEQPSTLHFDSWTFYGIDAPIVHGFHASGCLKAQAHCCPWYNFDSACTVWLSNLYFVIAPQPAEGMDAPAESE